MVSTVRSLRDDRRFVRWATADGISLTGSAVTTVVLPILVYQRTGSAAVTGALFAVRVVPYLVFGLLAGPVADRGNRRRLIVGGNLVEGTLVATIPFAAALGILTVAHVYIVAFLSATAFVFSDAAVFGAVPALVGTDRIAAANGALSALASMADIAGPVVAGLFVAEIGAASAVWVDAASFFIAAGLMASIRSTFRPTDELPRRASGREQLAATVSFVRSRPVIGILFATGFANSFAFGAMLGLLVPYAVTTLGLAKGSGLIGLLYGASGVGSLLAGLAFSRVFRANRVAWLTPASLLVSGAIAGALTASRSWPVAAPLLVIFSAAITTTIMTGITYRQLETPDNLRSSVNVIGRMISWGGQPFGALAGALLASALTVKFTYGCASAVMLVAAAAAGIALRRQHHAVPRPKTPRQRRGHK